MEMYKTQSQEVADESLNMITPQSLETQIFDKTPQTPNPKGTSECAHISNRASESTHSLKGVNNCTQENVQITKKIEKRGKRNRQYQKICQQTKNTLIQMVILKGLTIAEGAQILNLNYCSAKTIMFQYRHFKKGSLELVSTYKNIAIQDGNPKVVFVVQSSVSKKVVGSYDYFSRLNKTNQQ